MRLRAEEVFSFFVARKLLENFIGTPMELGMRSVMEKIAESMQGFVTVDLEAMTDRFSVIGDDHAVIEPAIWKTMVRAIHGCGQLAAVYQRFDGAVKAYQLEPHHLVAYHGNWYLLATNALDHRAEIFALSRFRSVTAQEQRFVRPKEYNPLDFIKDGFGITRGEKPMHVRLWFAPKVATYVKERIWHPSQTVREQPDGAVEIRLTTTGRKELIRWILSWTPYVKVLAPATLRKRVLGLLKDGWRQQIT